MTFNVAATYVYTMWWRHQISNIPTWCPPALKQCPRWVVDLQRKYYFLSVVWRTALIRNIHRNFYWAYLRLHFTATNFYIENVIYLPKQFIYLNYLFKLIHKKKILNFKKLYWQLFLLFFYIVLKFYLKNKNKHYYSILKIIYLFCFYM